MLDHEALHRTFREDQAAGARDHAAKLVRQMAGREGAAATDWRPSPWVLALVREARRNPCVHSPRSGAMVAVILAHVRRLMCRPCADRAVAGMRGRPDEVRCDLCREVRPLSPFAFLVAATLIVSGRCCAGCRLMVIGEAA